MKAISLITSTFFDDGVKSKERWALDSLRHSIEKIVKVGPNSYNALFEQKMDESEVDLWTEKEHGPNAASVSSVFSGLNAPTPAA